LPGLLRIRQAAVQSWTEAHKADLARRAWPCRFRLTKKRGADADACRGMPRREDGPVKDSNLNLNGLTFLVADPSAYFCTVIHGILRSFGASKVLETRDARGVVQNLTEHRIDILLLD